MEDVDVVSGWKRAGDLSLVLSFAVILCCVGVAVAAAWHWPLVGDEALMHYVVLLMRHGRAPYRQIIDINLPGSYLVDAVVMRLFGAGAHGLRMYDGLLCLVICGGSVVLSRVGWRGRVLGGIAGLLFVLIHLRDGLLQAGQRDLAMTAIAVVALAILVRRPAGRSIWAVMGFQLLVGVTLTLKPGLALLELAPLFSTVPLSPGRKGRLRLFVYSLPFLLLPWLVTAIWLYRWGSLTAFMRAMASLEGVHGGVARRPVLWLLAHAFDPVAALLLVFVVVAYLYRNRLDEEDKLLLLGAAAGLVSLVAQGKGFPYQRYPFLVFGLIAGFRFLSRAWDEGGWPGRVALAAVVGVSLALAPLYASAVVGFDREAQLVSSLSGALTKLPDADGNVQCFDTVGGCVNALYNLGLVQATGYLYDCYAYAGPAQSQRNYREGFLRAFLEARPKYVVLSSQFCLEPAGHFDRVDQWPELKEMLGSDYRLGERWESQRSERWWSRPELPFAYEIFVRVR